MQRNKEDFGKYYQNFTDTLTYGQEGEKIFKQYFEKKYPDVKISFNFDWKNKSFDLIDSKYKTYECKSHRNINNYSTFPLEILQNRNDEKSTPSYITNPADYVIQIDRVACIFHIYSGKLLSEYALNNKDKARPFNKATSLGILVPWRCKEAGWLGSISYVNLK